MTIDARTYVNFDKRHPASLAGGAGKTLVVNSGENAYELATFSSGHHNDIFGGNATVSANTITFEPCSCWDSTRLVWLETIADKTVVLPSTTDTVQTKYYIYLVKLDSDGSCEWRAYTAKAGAGANSPEVDTDITQWRYRTFWRTLTTGVAVLAVLTRNILSFVKSSQNISTVALTTSYATVNHADLLDVDAIDEIWYGVKDVTGVSDAYVYASLDGTNMDFQLFRAYMTNSDTDINSWGTVGSGGFFGFCAYVPTRKFKGTTNVPKLAFKAVKLKL